MDGVHDMGGKPGFGRVEREEHEPPFHGRWEAKVFTILMAGMKAGVWNNADRFRHAIERIDPVAYLNHGYYGRWLGGIETLLVEAGVVTRAEITRRAVSLGGVSDDLIASRPAEQPDPQNETPPLPGSIRALDDPPRFAVGDRVRTGAKAVPVHTRLPEYARGKVGEIIAHHDGWVFPDTNAHGRGEQPQHLYTVRFEAETLWQRRGSSPGFSVYLDLFEPYLQAAEETYDDE